MNFVDIKKLRTFRGMHILANIIDIKKPSTFRGIPIFMDFMISTKPKKLGFQRIFINKYTRIYVMTNVERIFTKIMFSLKPG